jgi:hypothetical protein
MTALTVVQGLDVPKWQRAFGDRYNGTEAHLLAFTRMPKSR